jgi:hypothetical protein
MAKFVSIDRLERTGRLAEALVEAEPEGSGRRRRWRVQQPGENKRPVYLPDALFHELFAPIDRCVHAVFTPTGAITPN